MSAPRVLVPDVDPPEVTLSADEAHHVVHVLRLEAGDPAVRIGTFEKAARALGLSLTLRELQRRRPTLEELGALYHEDDATSEEPDTQ